MSSPAPLLADPPVEPSFSVQDWASPVQDSASPDPDPAPAAPAPAALPGSPPPEAAPVPAALPGPPPPEAAPAPAPAAPSGPTALVSDGHRLEWHLARPPGSVARGGVRSGLVIAHDLPVGEGAAPTAPVTFPELAERIARDTGWLALSFSLRGAGRSAGSFSPGGWLRDVGAAVALLRPEVASVFVVGFGFGGTLALRAAALDRSIGGVGVLGTPSDLMAWAADVEALGAVVAEAGYLRQSPEDLAGWADDLRDIDPLGSAAAIPPRPLLIIHGSDDREVPLVDGRALSDAAEDVAELRVIPTAGHRLRHDPRAVALLLGWLQRHAG